MRGVKGILYRFGVGLRRVVVIGAEDIATTFSTALKTRRELGYSVVGAFSHFSDTVAEKIVPLGPDEVLYPNPRAHEKEALAVIDFCNEHNIVCKYSADLFATYSTNMAVSALAGVPIIELRRTPLEAWGRVVKRLFDIVVSLVLIILTIPITLLASLIILVETGRPVMYKNERVGRHGGSFFTYKFRSMYQKDCTGPQFPKTRAAAEARERELIAAQNSKAGPVYKIADDPRVTPFGRLLRRLSIDELPQFFNVLRGEMSIVGPRPHQPREVAQYEKHHKKVFTLKPGITGLAQISGRSDLTFEEEVRLDVFYIEQWSLWQDIIIVLKTPFVLFKRRKVL
jgi:exopolysaccharide biosynthesis polyprenyl glycosylphosphotransferase